MVALGFCGCRLSNSLSLHSSETRNAPAMQEDQEAIETQSDKSDLLLWILLFVFVGGISLLVSWHVNLDSENLVRDMQSQKASKWHGLRLQQDHWKCLVCLSWTRNRFFSDCSALGFFLKGFWKTSSLPLGPNGAKRCTFAATLVQGVWYPAWQRIPMFWVLNTAFTPWAKLLQIKWVEDPIFIVIGSNLYQSLWSSWWGCVHFSMSEWWNFEVLCHRQLRQNNEARSLLLSSTVWLICRQGSGLCVNYCHCWCPLLSWKIHHSHVAPLLPFFWVAFCWEAQPNLVMQKVKEGRNKDHWPSWPSW